MFKKDKKYNLKHLNDIYYIIYTENEELLKEKLKNYILSDDFYSDTEIQEAKEKFERNNKS